MCARARLRAHPYVYGAFGARHFVHAQPYVSTYACACVTCMTVRPSTCVCEHMQVSLYVSLSVSTEDSANMQVHLSMCHCVVVCALTYRQNTAEAAVLKNHVVLVAVVVVAAAAPLLIAPRPKLLASQYLARVHAHRKHV